MRDAMNQNKNSSFSLSSDLKNRIVFLLLAILIYRVGSYIPISGLDPARLAKLFSTQQNSMLGLFNMFSGGSLQRFSVFALGVMPYISASIVIQLMSVISPSLAAIRKEGEAGQRKINQYTRYATLLLASVQAVGISKMLATHGIALYPDFSFYFITTLSLVTGTMFLMWLGEQITERGIGNGISMLIFAGIIAGMPSAIVKTFEQVREGQIQFFVLCLILVAIVLVVATVVFFERAQRKIPIHYARRSQSANDFSAQTSHLPLKINMSGVIPPIFASSLLLFPATLAQWFSDSKHMSWLTSISVSLQQGQPLHMLLFGLAIIFFSFFYSALIFDPKETADNLKKSGAVIPSIRPGEQTAKYIDGVMSRLTLCGSFYVMSICLIPELLILTWNVPFYFGGTSLLIIVVVIMDFMAQIQSHLMSNRYESLINKKRGKNGSKNPAFSSLNR